MEIQQLRACWPSTRGLFVLLYRTTMPLHALMNTPLYVLTLMLGYGAWPAHCASLQGSSSDAEYSVGDDSYDNQGSQSEPKMAGYPLPGEKVPGFRYSYNAVATQKYMYEGVVICLLAVTAFIGLVVWVLKSNFEERQTRRMRREASLRDRNSNVSPLMTPDSEES